VAAAADDEDDEDDEEGDCDSNVNHADGSAAVSSTTFTAALAEGVEEADAAEAIHGVGDWPTAKDVDDKDDDGPAPLGTGGGGKPTTGRSNAFMYKTGDCWANSSHSRIKYYSSAQTAAQQQSNSSSSSRSSSSNNQYIAQSFFGLHAPDPTQRPKSPQHHVHQWQASRIIN
jgi:hypothetical protein